MSLTTSESTVCQTATGNIINSSLKCFEGLIPPNITDCNQKVFILRLFLFHCYIDRLFFPIVTSLVVIGTLLNLFSLCCFLKMNKRNSQNVYLSVLSLSDTINLHINFTVPLLRGWSEQMDSFFDSSKVLCRINGFFTEFFLIFPTWIIVLLTCERLISIMWPLKCYSLYTHRRAKISIIFLAFFIMILCLYRFVDLKGIDQVSVFSITACDDPWHKSLDFIVKSNLIIWAILPECLTLIMSLIIIYNIKLATQLFQPCQSKARQTKYNQANKTVLLISILFIVCHTPTGMVITWHLIHRPQDYMTLEFFIILVSRKFTVILYEISLCCKFFIYNRTFQNFKNILHTSLSRFTRQSNSAKLGRPVLGMNYVRNQHAKTFQFGQNKRHRNYVAKETDNLVRPQKRNSGKTSTSASQGSRDQQQQQRQQHMAVLMMKSNVDIQVALFDTPNLLRRFTTDTKETSNNRLLWRCKPQTTL
ncbi:unnamed protein product [Adineta ricciae]|uniref:G-protein coupled receptors family 1 profile domain-containing protein n=1 Tax=Adineta ricciae TaxID=249248 RepID=A0A814GMB3_ADIRI|nr:unnamed protein product [Adineta ricciae]